MFNLQMTPAAMMKRLPLLCLCLLTRSGATFADEHGSGVVRVVVEEGSDAILPCSLSNKENAEEKLFDWKKDGQKEVFFYDGGIHYNNGRPGQDRQFKGRISHFQDELKYGNASIIISKTKMTDSGNYTCDFPRLQPRRIFNIQFVVAVAAQKPSVTAIDQTEDGVLLQCEVRGASPKPTVEWQDSAGNILPAEEPQVSERGGSYDIILQTTVNTTDRFTCVVTQDEISHQIFAEIYVQVDGSPAGWFVAVLVIFLAVLILLAVLIAKGVIPLNCQKDIRKTTGTGYTNRSLAEPLSKPAKDQIV
ncbi:butyrophilin subfamily 3 member A2-like isoform X2 [Micropterus salmoides]|uniref:butyrophilin subfamily 3 member A2-like isoform X2 n=1 Tax=Micropterus salmoides TaxID=27706 RepID=UPI0018ECF5AA|nr:butyrophilin subfamily 3 member A2-like isoform X2 [Micropterus salmoides]